MLENGMELFRRATAIKLSHNDMYLVAKDDQESVCLEREGTSKNVIWAVEFVSPSAGKNYVRFRSCYDRYLTASNVLLRRGSMEKKVLQTMAEQDESSINWVPIREDFFSWQFQNPAGSFLRRNWGLPPLWNPVTHDIPRRTRMQKVLWEIEVVGAMPKPPFSCPLPIPPNVHRPWTLNATLPAKPSPPPKFGKDNDHVPWPLPHPPIRFHPK